MQKIRGRKALPVASELVRRPVYGSIPGQDSADTISDAEWEDVLEEDVLPERGPEADEPGTSSDAGFRERWSKLRADFFDTEQQRMADVKAADREQRRQATNARKAEPRLSERELLRQVPENVKAAGDAFMHSLRESNIHAPGLNDHDRKKKLSALETVYVENMMMAGMRPLQEGVNANSIVRVMSTMSALYLISPQFRQRANEQAEPIRKAIQENIDKMAAGAKGALETSPLVPSPWRKGPKFLQRRLDDMQFRDRDHRHLYTPRSAGLTEVALAENAFAAMREPNADTAKITESHELMIARLYRQASEDGISPEEVAASARIVLGERIVEDPSVQVKFQGLSHGQHRMAPPRDIRLAGTDRIQSVWQGEFEDCVGQPVDPTRYADTKHREGVQGAFTVRGHMGNEDHVTQMASTMAMTMTRAAERGDMAAFNEDLAGYMVGCVASAREFDGGDMPAGMSSRIGQSRVMQASMAADGVSETRQRMLFSQAYADAVHTVQVQYPEFAAEWGEQYADSWQDFTDYLGVDLKDANERWQQRTAAHAKAKSKPAPEPNSKSQSRSAPGPEFGA